MAKARQKRAKSGRKEGVLRELNTNKTLYLMCLPALLLLFLLCYLPFGGIWMAFTDFNALDGVFGSPFVGLRNFSIFFKQLTAWNVVKNTLIINFFGIILGLIVPISLAIFLNEMRLGIYKRVVQSVMFFPYFLSWVVVSYFVYAFLNPDKGLMNTIIQFFGGDKIMWYSQPKWWPLILTFMQVWKSMGYNMVVYLASITGIDSTLYEAATLDGATKWQQTKYITLPALKPIIVMMFILNVGHIFYSDFGLFYQVTQGVPNSLYNVASTFDTYVYQALQSNVTIGRTAAAGLFQAACCCATVLVANFIVSKIDEESAII